MRTQRYTKKNIIEALRKAKGIKLLAAQVLSCDRSTIENYIQRYPEVAQVYSEERESFVDVAEAKLWEKVREGEWPAILFTLRTLGKNRGYTEGQELGIEHSGKIEHTLSNEERVKMAEIILRLHGNGEERS